MFKQWSAIGLLALLSLTVGCTQSPPKPQASPSEPPATFTAPINNAKQKANDIQQKALEREQMNPEASPQPAPTQSN